MLSKEEMTMNKNILLTGVGGQGTVLASKLLAAAAMEKGLAVMSAETIGMAQMGGSVFSHLKIGNELLSPMLGANSADVIIGFEPAETVRLLSYLKPNGTVIVNTEPIIPVTSALMNIPYTGSEMLDYLKANTKNLIMIDCHTACKEIGSFKTLNVVLLGAAIESGAIPLTKDDIKNAMKKELKPELLELNYRALDYTKNERNK